jgi:lysozyme family protein
MVHVSGAAGMATKSVTLKAGTIHTLVVLDGAGGSLMIDNLVDAAGSAAPPAGGAATGLGGTAPVPAPSPAPWAAAIVAGALCSVAAAYWLRRVRHQARHAR